jgi:protein arginine N-methyltransferase 1
MPQKDRGYPLKGYGAMISDKFRLEAYTAALKAVIKSDSVVLDLGAGPGFFSLLACRLGARKVFAIEPNSSIRLLPELAKLNGYGDRIVAIQAMSTEVNIDEVADIVVADLRNVLPFHGFNIPSIVDARTRLMKENGKLIPSLDQVFVAPVTAPEIYERQVVSPWMCNASGINMSPIAEIESNRVAKVYFGESNLAGRPFLSMELNYEAQINPSMTGRITSTIDKRCEVHGLGVWFDSRLAPTVRMSNHPARPPLIYGQSFFPFERPVEVYRGVTLNGELSAHWIDGQYVWRWQGEFRADCGSLAQFDQSTFKTKLNFDKFGKRAQQL